MGAFFYCCIVSLSMVTGDNGIDGYVTAVIDGNTLEVLTEENEKLRIVLLGIDCPELSQEYGSQAKEAIEKWLLHQDVVIYLHGKDRLRNHISIVLLKDGSDVRARLLEWGLAWTSEQNPLPELESIRIQAVEQKKGLWKQNDPTPPWIYRRQQSMLEPKSR